MASAGGGRFRVVVIGVSTGGVEALSAVLGRLPADFPVPLLIVQHLGPDSGDALARLLDQRSLLRVKEADDGEAIYPGTAYLAPPNYHLLVEPTERLALSVDPPVCYARPSADVLFESAADHFGPGVIGVVLTGANGDGSQGLKAIKARGGLAIVQDPAGAAAPGMPLAALAEVQVDHVSPLAQLADLLLRVVGHDDGRVAGGRPGSPPG